jgi:hypothetical protein
MAKQTINIGSAANDGTGDPLRTAFDKINDNFQELYDRFGGSTVPNIEIVGSEIENKVTNENITLTTNGTGTISLGADTSVTGDITYTGKLVSGATDNVGTSATALSLDATVHILAANEANYTLAAGSEGQIMHFVLGGGDSTADAGASTTVTISNVRDPRDQDVLATYAWKPFINPGSDLDDSTTATRTLATCVYAAGSWHLDNFVRL